MLPSMPDRLWVWVLRPASVLLFVVIAVREYRQFVAAGQSGALPLFLLSMLLLALVIDAFRYFSRRKHRVHT